MDNGLQDVISAAVNGAGRKPAKTATGRRVPQLSVVGMDRSAAPEAAPDAGSAPAVPPETTFRSAPNGGSGQLGHIGLRLAFWVCGFHAALMERHQNGEQLSKKEELLLTLSPSDFVGIRPHVIDMTLSRLEAVVNASDLPAKPKDFAAIHPMEGFGLTTLRSLSRRARRTFEEEGPDAALSLFGDAAGVMEPLAIFRLVFTTALDLVESFERLVPGETALLAQLAEALDSEVDRI